MYPIQFYEFRTWGLLLKWLRVGVFNKAKLSSIFVNPLLILTIANYNNVDKPVARHVNTANQSDGNDSRKRQIKSLISKIVTIYPHGLNKISSVPFSSLPFPPLHSAPFPSLPSFPFPSLPVHFLLFNVHFHNSHITVGSLQSLIKMLATCCHIDR